MLKLFNENGLTLGRMMYGSKSGYRDLYPDNFTVFNANVIDAKTLAKVWYGDLDITLNGEKLRKIANEVKTELLVLYEMDARFGNELEPNVANYVWSTKTGVSERMKQYYPNEK